MAGSLTPRLGLYKPDGDDFIDEDTDINANYDKIDSLAGGPFVILNAGGRPLTPYTGQMVYEIDSNRLLIFTDDNKWTTITGRNLGPAKLSTADFVSATTAPAGTGGSVLVHTNIAADGVSTFALNASWAGISSNDQMDSSGDGCVVVIQRYAAGGATALANVMSSYHSMGVGVPSIGAGGGGTLICEDKPAAGNYDYRLRFWRTGGNNTYTLQSATAYPLRFAISEVPGAKYNV